MPDEPKIGFNFYRDFVDRADVFEACPDPNEYPLANGPFPYQGEVYHTDTKRLSSSVAKTIQNDPDKQRRKLAGEVMGSNDSMDFGQVVGELLALATGGLDSTVESKRFFFADVARPDKRTKVGQATWGFTESHANGRSIVWLDQFTSAKRCADRLLSHPEIAGFMFGSHVLSEWALQARLAEFSNVDAKCMFDWIKFVGPNQVEVLDIKTSCSPDPWGFRRQVFEFGYHVQERVYRSVANACGLQVVRFRFAVVGSDESAYPAVYELQKEFWLDLATRPVAEAAAKFQAIKTGEFDWLPNWSHGTVRIETKAEK